jgi:hypothetical protein
VGIYSVWTRNGVKKQGYITVQTGIKTNEINPKYVDHENGAKGSINAATSSSGPNEQKVKIEKREKR